MITNLLAEFKKETNGVGMNFGARTEIEIHEKGFYSKVEFILAACEEVEELIKEQEEAKVDYLGATDTEAERELIKDINKLNKGKSNSRD